MRGEASKDMNTLFFPCRQTLSLTLSPGERELQLNIEAWQ
jgi:hypothetical protein